MLEHVPPNVKTALDVGCGAGSFGLMLRSHTGAEVWGIEMVEEPAQYAAERLDQVFTGDAMEILPTLPPGKFDLITYTDVLEHLARPDLALEYSKPLLTPDGFVLASLPNIRYWEAFKRILLEGDFPQEDNGIFDRTHLRFFTEKSMRRLFEENGFEIVKMVGLNPTLSLKLRMVNLLSGGRYWDAQFLQFLILAKVRPTP